MTLKEDDVSGYPFDDLFGVKTSYADFDGTNDYIATTIDENDFPTDACTIACWVKVNSLASQQFVYFSSAGGINDSPALVINTNGSLLVLVRGASATASVTTATGIISTDTWYHIVVVGDTSGVEVFVDAVSKGSNATATGAWGAWANMDLGRRTGVGGTYVNGSLDEVGFWDNTLNSTQISELYNNGDGLKYSEITGGLATDLFTYYSFDNNAEDELGANDGTLNGATLINGRTAAIDVTTNGNTGTVNGATRQVTKLGQGAYSFDGSDYLENPSITLNTTNVTLSAWVQFTTVGVKSTIIEVDDSATGFTGTGLSFRDNTAGKFRFIVYDGTTIISLETTTANYTDVNRWYHVVGTYDGTTSKLYVDGVQDGSTTGTINPMTLNSITLGANRNGASSHANFHNGILDELGVWDTDLDATEISTLYNAGVGLSHSELGSLTTNLVSYYGLDGNADDDEGGNDLTVTGATLQEVKLGDGAYSFITNDYIDLADHTLLEFSNDFSVSFWIKYTQSDSVIRTIACTAFDPNGGQGSGYNIFTFQGKIFFDKWTSNSVVPRANSTSLYNDDAWHFVTITQDSTNGMEIKVDDVTDGTNADTNNVFYDGNANEDYSFIGACRNDGAVGNYLDAALDSIHFFDVALTDDNITTLFNSGAGLEYPFTVEELAAINVIFFGNNF